MIQSLSPTQIETILRSEVIGRIGCSEHDKTYIIPITYAYDRNSIYAQSRPGKKISVMRLHRNVCFQVDIIEDQENWRSVIAWGIYEELADESVYQKASKILRDRLQPFHTNSITKAGLDLSRAPLEIDREAKPIIFRINITELSGRFEKE